MRFLLFCFLTQAILFLSTDAYSEADPAVTIAPPIVRPTASLSAPKELEGHGVVLGVIEDIDKNGRWIFVRPNEIKAPRRVFYLDKETLFMAGKKKLTLGDLQNGNKTAVVFFAKGMLAIADAVFLVKDEYKLSEYRIPAGRNRAKKSSGAEKKSSGSH